MVSFLLLQQGLTRIYSTTYDQGVYLIFEFSMGAFIGGGGGGLLEMGVI